MRCDPVHIAGKHALAVLGLQLLKNKSDQVIKPTMESTYDQALHKLPSPMHLTSFLAVQPPAGLTLVYALPCCVDHSANASTGFACTHEDS